jgi:RNA-directed DNA polymerase
MMHGHEKSDPAIVAKKPTNKAGQPASEPVERSAGAKGNADQQSTRRAQHRESVTQALDRVRQLASRGKRRSSPRSSTSQYPDASDGVLRTQEIGRTRRGRTDVAGLRNRPGP